MHKSFAINYTQIISDKLLLQITCHTSTPFNFRNEVTRAEWHLACERSYVVNDVSTMVPYGSLQLVCVEYTICIYDLLFDSLMPKLHHVSWSCVIIFNQFCELIVFL